MNKEEKQELDQEIDQLLAKINGCKDTVKLYEKRLQGLHNCLVEGYDEAGSLLVKTDIVFFLNSLRRDQLDDIIKRLMTFGRQLRSEVMDQKYKLLDQLLEKENQLKVDNLKLAQ